MIFLFWIFFLISVNLKLFFFSLSNRRPNCNCCIAMTNYTYTYACKNIFNTIKTSGHSSLGKYTSHFIRNGWKGLQKVMCERWVGDWTKTATYWPPSSSGHSSVSFSFSWAAQPGAWGSHSSIWNTDFKLWTPAAWLTVSPRLYHCFTPIQYNPSTVKVTPWSLWPDAPFIYTGAFLIDSLAGLEINMQHNSLIISLSNFNSMGRSNSKFKS